VIKAFVDAEVMWCFWDCRCNLCRK